MNPTSLTLHIADLSDLPNAADKLLEFAADARVFLFYGEMGAGKTTFTKAICERLSVTEPVSSPTFSIINEYKGTTGSIFHFDFYRLKNQSEALDMGYEEYFYSGNYCLIEWPEKIPDLLPEHYVKVSIRALSPTSREIIAEHI
ncbi:tRNA (adenosine(37)-N6)-threonylcarbamoyltransferase complex ATPase subunit type 1 TsaE [Mucilaginibacter sp. RS28]|uniref:tRNA threonylcarbamoyladenosine biosynthesis protein TsaE n=1 Tax=Mucilaginibacter straminoryzae TaxID=2932774 RepID=A0A9X2BD68_9SPHI|nr:tRNA (adenosine(37)-N6)-threonylcarbamoyltransferase complex ATPase subunit type 1 TsaE [Mucilaginibacter straminoryzae]MCJ8211772.1 tRNA (adenosine(37)-N6)-threonylcarbamoyltransferase complex ATPase subunit type 1 TsaE [Mucilaginibacter straminoryzae]